MIHGDCDKAIMPKDTPVLGIESQDVQLGGFQCEPRVQALTAQKIRYLPPDAVPFLNERVVTMMNAMGYMPGRWLGDRHVGIAEPVEPHMQGRKHAELGLQNQEGDTEDRFMEDLGCKAISINTSLNGFFVREGEDFPFCGFQEPWFNSKGKRVTGFEIFYVEDLYYR